MSAPVAAMPCPRACRCSWCSEPIAQGAPACPAGEMGMGRDKEQCWDHPACWAREYAGV